MRMDNGTVICDQCGRSMPAGTEGVVLPEAPLELHREFQFCDETCVAVWRAALATEPGAEKNTP